MRFILQVFLLLLFSTSSTFATDFSDIQVISLKKDELRKILVKYDGREKVLIFRWTLFKNGGLIMFNSYDTIVSQHILYMRQTNRSFRVQLKPSGVSFYNKPYVLIRFKDFNHDTNEAKLELLLSDDSKNIKLEHVENK